MRCWEGPDYRHSSLTGGASILLNDYPRQLHEPSNHETHHYSSMRQEEEEEEE